jgi:hypothetical protein
MKRVPFNAAWRTLACLGSMVFTTLCATAQSTELPMKPLPLNDLSQFKPVAKNWEIAGDVFFDPNETKNAKTSKGKGVLVNIPSDKNKDDLYTSLEHGDLDLELDFMMAKNSNSGIYLQGRYEIQLLDSWGVKVPKAGDCGGIYERWDDSKPEGQKGYEGYAPRVNVSRAPGLWQHLKISFQAPRFNSSGQKVANARILKAELNGVTIHENVELTGPTRGPMANDEKPLGPLRIQGDHGMVAFRNIRFKNYDKAPLALRDVKYSYYEGKFDKQPDFASLKPVMEGTTPEITWTMGKSPNEFAYRFTGTLNITEPGTYLFAMQTAGGGKLSIDGKPVINRDGVRDRWETVSGQTELKAGSYPFELTYFKSNQWQRPALGLFVEGPGIRYQPHDPGSLPQRDPVSPIHVAATTEPYIMRCFIDFDGKRKTHCAAVGEPGDISYSVDLLNGSLLQVWKGGFADATPMWNERGGNAMRPQGSVIKLSAAPSIARLNGKNDAWPDSLTADKSFRHQGYELDENGRPTFRYAYGDLQIADRITGQENKLLNREIQIQSAGNAADVWCRVAEGQTIDQLPDGSYGVNNKEYYVKITDSNGAKPVIREVNNRKELLVPVTLKTNTASVKYAIVW